MGCSFYNVHLSVLFKLRTGALHQAPFAPLYLFFAIQFLSSSSLWASPPPLDTLPVVVHVIHTGTPIGAPDNPTDASIHNMIELMNDAFQKDGLFYGGADIDLAFKLALRSPDCTPTNGIIRIDGSEVTNYETGGITTDSNSMISAYEIDVKELSRWPNTDYINIWVVNMIDGDPNGIAGYAYYPEYNSALTDGVVIRADAVNSFNKVIIHELGHYFNLDHTFAYAWESCDSEPNCLLYGDLVCDTENCRFTFDCEEDINPCTGDPYEIVDDMFNYTVLNNYMSYTNCQWMFTEGQKTRMLNALNSFRPGLLSSDAISEDFNDVPPMACEPTAVNGLSIYYGIQKVEFGGLSVYSHTSQGDGAFYIDRTCNQHITVNPGQSIFLRVTGSYTNTHQIKVYLDYNRDSDFDDSGELLLSSLGTGIDSTTVIIPAAPPVMCEPLRLRVIAEHPSAPPVSVCLLTGTSPDGVGQIEDYSVTIAARQVHSLSSGNWTAPSTWSCNCVPSAGDVVTIRTNHIIQVSQNQSCAHLSLQPGAQVIVQQGIHIFGGGCQ